MPDPLEPRDLPMDVGPGSRLGQPYCPGFETTQIELANTISIVKGDQHPTTSPTAEDRPFIKEEYTWRRKFTRLIRKSRMQFFDNRSSPYLQILTISFPTVLSQFVTALYTIIELAVVSHGSGTAQTSVSLNFAPFQSLFCVFPLQSLGTGTASQIAVAFGAGRVDDVQRLFTIFFITGVVIGIIIPMGIIPILPFFLPAAGIVKEHISSVLAYGTILLLFMPILTLFGPAMAPILRCENKAFMVMIRQLLGTLCNVVFILIFVLGLNLGSIGAAISSVLAMLISSTWICSYFFPLPSCCNRTPISCCDCYDWRDEQEVLTGNAFAIECEWLEAEKKARRGQRTERGRVDDLNNLAFLAYQQKMLGTAATQETKRIQYSPIRFRRKYLGCTRENARQALELIRLSVPTYLQLVILNIAAVFSLILHKNFAPPGQSHIRQIGVSSAARLTTIISAPISGLTVGILPVMGYHYGKKNYIRLYDTAIAALVILFCATLAQFVIFESFPSFIVAILRLEDAYSAGSVRAMRILNAMAFMNSFVILYNIVLQVENRNLATVILQLCRCGLQITWQFGTALGLHDSRIIVASVPFADGITGLVSVFGLIRAFKRLKVLAEEERAYEQTIRELLEADSPPIRGDPVHSQCTVGSVEVILSPDEK